MKVVEVNHPLIQHKLGLLRHADISTREFRQLTRELGTLLAFSASSDFEVEDVEIESWCGPTTVKQIKGKKTTVVPILRAGIGLMDGVLDLLPSAKISVIGIYRDEKTLEPVPYFEKLTDKLDERHAIVVDPMLATGGSLIASIDLLKKNGCKNITAIVLVAAPEGLKNLEKSHPDISIYTAAIDSHLNEQGYIIPGLGDAGDKIFGTK